MRGSVMVEEEDEVGRKRKMEKRKGMRKKSIDLIWNHLLLEDKYGGKWRF